MDRMETFESVELIPGLPSELGLECLTRLPYTAHRLASAVCHQWRRLFRSADFYYHRKEWGYTHRVACLIQSLPEEDEGASGGRKERAGYPVLGISVFDPVSRTWERLAPVPKYPAGLPLFSQLCGSEGKLVVMGGWDPVSYEPVTDVFIYDFTTGRWRQGKEMPSKRSFFAIGAAAERGGGIYVAGGHDKGKNALSSAWVYDVNRDEWSELARMSQERDECEGAVVAGEFWVVSGYGTESQGAFEGTAEAYDRSTGEWRRIDGAWAEGRCPRARVGVGSDGRLLHWGESESESDSNVRVGTCGVMLGPGASLVSGSEYEGASQGIFLVEHREGQSGKMEMVHVSTEFSGFVQSGCCMEI